MSEDRDVAQVNEEIFGDEDSDDEDFYGFEVDSDEREGNYDSEDSSEDEAELPADQRQDSAFCAYSHNTPIQHKNHIC